MMMLKQLTKNPIKLLGVLCVLALVGYFIYRLVQKRKKERFATEGEGATGQYAIGGIINNQPNFDLIDPSNDTFADLVAPVEPAACTSTLPLPQPAGVNFDTRDLLPDINTHTTAYDADISDPEVFMWRPSIRTSIPNRQHIGADPLRGDLPITKDSCGYSNNGWFSSRYGEGDAKTDAYFSEHNNAKFRSLVGQKSYPQHIANEGTIMDYQPQADEIVMDYY